jgi:alpha-beta hydrolase superfamily lysophospholipase
MPAHARSSFWSPRPDFGQARVAAQPDGVLVGIRKPLAAHERPPEHPFPPELEDSLRAYQWLIRRATPEDVVVVGASSGGGLATWLLLKLKQERAALPGAAVLLCPWLDLAERIPSEPARLFLRHQWTRCACAPASRLRLAPRRAGSARCALRGYAGGHNRLRTRHRGDGDLGSAGSQTRSSHP